MSDTITGVTEIDAASLADISSIVQSYLFQKSMLLPAVTDYSRFAVKGAKSVDLPRSGGWTVGTKSENTAADASAITYSADTIAFDKHRYIQWLNEDIADRQAIIALVQDQLKKAGADMGTDADSLVVDQLKLASSSTPDHQIVFIDTATDVVARADVLASRKLLMDQFINPRECFIGVGPEKEKELLNISDFIDASKYGSNEPIMNGEIGKIYGMKVLVNTLFEDFMCTWHPSAVGFAFQKAVTFDQQKDLANIGVRYSLDYIAGFKVLDTGKRCVMTDSTN